MYKICAYCPFKSAFGCFKKVSLRIYRVFGFFRCYLAFLKVDLAFFAYDYLATLCLHAVLPACMNVNQI